LAKEGIVMFDKQKRLEEIDNTDRRAHGWQDFITQIISQEKSMIAEAVEKENEKAFRVLNDYGVPKERARSISNGIQVLVTRMDKEIYFLKIALAQAEKEAVKEFAEKLKLFGFWKDDCDAVIIYAADIDKLLKEYEVGK
jgi:hypothetical protein